MRWRGERQSENVEDRRDESGGFGFPLPGGGVRFPSGGGGGSGSGGGIGLIGFLILLGLALLFGVDPRVILSGGGPTGDDTNFPDIHLPQSRPGAPGLPTPQQQPGPQVQHPKTTQADDLKQFVSVVLADTEDVWSDIFQKYGQRYEDPKLVLYSDGIRSACGMGMSAMGPFYCPNDEKVYIDLSFYEELKNRFNAPGDFAQAYVIAHEVGHHVQKLLGIADQVAGCTPAVEREGRQRDAGAHGAAGRLLCRRVGQPCARRRRTSSSRATSSKRLAAASAIGDDRIQRQTRGYVVPDSFTHGSSAQRVRWFRRGYEDGELEDCDTFNASQL